jgi:hypothetical protein
MPYTRDDGGRINNFANEPKVYSAEPPTTKEKRNYVLLGVIGVLLVVGVITIAVFASNM